MDSLNLLSSVDGMSEIHFVAKDVIYIVSLVVSILVVFFGLKASIKEVESKKEKLKIDSNHKIDTLNNRISNNYSIFKESEKTLHQRIDRVRDDGIRGHEKLENKMEELSKKQDENTSRILEALSTHGK